MKFLIATLLLVSGSVFAQVDTNRELDATEALLKILPAGNYFGLTPEGKSCQVLVRDLGNKVAVTASTGSLSRFSSVNSGDVYRWNPANRSFLFSYVSRTVYGSTTNILRTIADTEHTQYVVVGDQMVSDRETKETVVECVIEL